MNNRNKRLMAFYGDDFTGSTDALEFLSRSGARTVLFIEPPAKEVLAKYKDLDAFGVAGMTRAMLPDNMEKTLGLHFSQLALLDLEHLHYKVCSTFDSSPTIGSIGKAIDVGSNIFINRFIPLVVAAPPLGRYCVFGNLFARMGIGSSGSIYRLDHHPSMSKHPVTPADESDLRLHLSKQTNKKIGLLDILAIHQPADAINAMVELMIKQNHEVILIDALYDEQLMTIGELLVTHTLGSSTLFSVGSSGIEMALGKYWNKKSIYVPKHDWVNVEGVDSLLVLSGSCSPITTQQILWAKQNGFKEVIINAEALAIYAANDILLKEPLELALSFLSEGNSVIVHTGGNQQSKSFNREQAANLGTALGNLGKAILAQSSVKRLVIAGGDTSSYAGRALGIEAVEMIAPMVPGAPLCKAYASNSPVDGLEVNFKGGQVGDECYFGFLRDGKHQTHHTSIEYSTK